MRPLPQSLHDRAELLSRSHQLQVVARLIGVLPSQITRMKQRGWRAPGERQWKGLRPMPSDFAIQSRHMSTRELSAHYGTCSRVIARWMRDLPNARPPMKPGKKVRP